MPQGRPSSAAASAAASAKSMRKGTHSCFQCRRRKKRCIYSADDPSICITCRNKGFECIEQRPAQLQAITVDNRLNLKDRVAKLEAIIQSLASGGGGSSSAVGPTDVLPDTPKSFDNAPSSGNAKNLPTISSTSDDNCEFLGPDIGQKIGPISSIFNNPIWRSNDSDQAITNITPIGGAPSRSKDSKLHAKRVRTREALLSHLPDPELLGDILNATASWWYSWRPLGHSISDIRFDSLQEFIVWAFNSEDPSIVGMAILCVSVSIQQLSPDDHELLLRRLPHPPGVLVREYFTQVEALIVNDSYYASTSEGISVILMSAKTQMNLGAIKKTWILYHRAISYCQLLGLHRPSRLHVGETDKEFRQRLLSWVSICGADVYLSLLLGLPYASDCRTFPSSFHGESGTSSAFGHYLLRSSVQVIDRNQMGLSTSTDLTKNIQLEIETFARAMPREFWDCDAALTNGQITKDRYVECITSQMYYHHLKVSLHMPLMIQSVEDPELEAHRLACLEASRGLLKTYHIMRSDKDSAFNMVKIIDYQAFICAALLLLGVLGYGTSPSIDQSFQHAQDQELVDSVMGLLRQAARTSDNIIALQALQGLETLSALPRMKGCPPNLKEAGQCPTPFLKITVPYAGIITISAGEFLRDQRRLEKSAQEPIMNPPPVFTLSHGIFQSLQDQHQVQPISEGHNSQSPGAALGTDQGGSEAGLNVPSIDFDWDSMINMQADSDWEWLNDFNNSTTGFL